MKKGQKRSLTLRTADLNFVTYLAVEDEEGLLALLLLLVGVAEGIDDSSEVEVVLDEPAAALLRVVCWVEEGSWL